MAKPTAEEMAARASARARAGVAGTPTVVQPAAASTTPSGTSPAEPVTNLGRTEDILPTVPAATPPPVMPPSVSATVASPVVEPPTDSGIPDFLFATETPPPVTQPITKPMTQPVEPAEGLSEQQKVNFHNLRKAKEDAERRLAEVYDDTGKIKDEFVKALKIPSTDVQQIQRERDEALDRLAKVDLQSDPRWQAKYATAETVAKQAILRIAREYEVDVAQVQDALALPLKQRIKFFNDNLPDALSMISPHLAKLDEIQEQKLLDVQNASRVQQQMGLDTAVAREAAIKQVRNTLHSQVTRELEDAGYFPFKTIPGNSEWNKGVEGVKGRVMELLSSNDPLIQSRAIAAGAAAPVLLQAIRVANSKIKELTKQLQLHSGAGATINAAAGRAPAPVNVDTSKMTPQQLARMNIEEARARRGQ